jgi:hypothetical protein
MFTPDYERVPHLKAAGYRCKHDLRKLLIIGVFTYVNILWLHSNPLGVMCQYFFRCEAARALLNEQQQGHDSRCAATRRMSFQGMGTLWPRCRMNCLLSVEESRLARRPPRKRRVAAFTPRSESTLGTGLNSSEREDIQTIARQVFSRRWLGSNGTDNQLKNRVPLPHFYRFDALGKRPARCLNLSAATPA